MGYLDFLLNVSFNHEAHKGESRTVIPLNEIELKPLVQKVGEKEKIYWAPVTNNDFDGICFCLVMCATMLELQGKKSAGRLVRKVLERIMSNRV